MNDPGRAAATGPRGAQPRRARGRPRSDDVELIDSELLDGALKEFLKTGYGGTSISQIVKSLGISKTTLYSRYKSKPELFEAIVSQQIKRFSADVVFDMDGNRPSLDAGLRAYARRTLEISLEGDILEVNRLIYSESHRFPELGQASAERSDLGIRQIAGFIAESAVRDGVPCHDPTGIATAFIFMLRGWYVNVMLINEPVGPAVIRRFVDQVVRVIVAGREAW